MSDPTRQRDQPALTTSSGLIWLVLGGVLAAVAIGVLIALLAAPPAGVALTGAIIVAALYLGMLAARFAVRPGRLRLGILAGLMIAIAAVGVFSVLIVAAAVSV